MLTSLLWSKATHVFTKACLVLLSSVSLITLAYGAYRRGPWLDELTTLYFVSDLGGFISRYTGDPHPIGYYLLVLFSHAISDSFLWLRLFPIFLTLSITLAISYRLTASKDRADWWKNVGLIGPACFGVGVFVYSGTDIRMYGALTVSTLVLAIAYYFWKPRQAESLTATSMVAALLILVAVLHVWGAIIGLVYTVLFVSKSGHNVRPLSLALIFAVAAPVAYLAYLYGPLSRDLSSWEDFLKFSWGRYLSFFGKGISKNVYIGLSLMGCYFLSLSLRDKRVFASFDLPAIVVACLAGLISLQLPIVKQYTIMPVLSLFFMGMLIRLQQKSVKLLAMCLLLVSANFLISARTITEEKQDWIKSTQFLLSILDEDDRNCPVLAIPGGRRLYNTQYFLRDVEVLPLSRDSIASCKCETGLFMWIGMQD